MPVTMCTINNTVLQFLEHSKENQKVQSTILITYCSIYHQILKQKRIIQKLNRKKLSKS